MEWYKNVISRWHHSRVVASGDLQNLNIFILKIAIEELYSCGTIFTLLNGAEAIFSHGIK